MSISEVETLPLLTADLPGIGGQIKRYNEDFFVEEIPLYPCAGAGTHTFFTIEKQGMTTLAAIQIVATALGRPPRDFGYAGLKDAHGVTRQMLSVEHIDPQRVAALEVARIKILSVDRHGNKLKLGHLAGNRFKLKIRETGPAALTHAQAVLDLLVRRGVPNYFGPQRFGSRGDNAQVGRAILTENYDEAVAIILGRPSAFDHGRVLEARQFFEAGDYAHALAAWPPAMREQIRVCRAMLKNAGDARRAWQAVDHTLRRLYASAFQSELFNRVLARRIQAIDIVYEGDLAWKHANGACFRVEDAAVEQPRCAAKEISPTGPLFGRRMTEPGGIAARMEIDCLEEAAITRDLLQAKHSPVDGARRPLRVPLKDAGIEAGTDERGPYVELTFALPAGAYATNVTSEICKRA